MKNLDIKALYYLGCIMFILVLFIFIYGWCSFAKKKTTTRFWNLKLLIPTLATGVVGLILSIIPLTMQIWTYSADVIKVDAWLLTLLVLEYIFLTSLLVIVYVFSYDFGIAVDENNVYFFGQTVNTTKIVALDQKKYVLKIVFTQGIKNIKRRLTVITPLAQLFVKSHLSQKVDDNENVIESVNDNKDVDDNENVIESVNDNKDVNDNSDK